MFNGVMGTTLGQPLVFEDDVAVTAAAVEAGDTWGESDLTLEFSLVRADVSDLGSMF
jgi:hypothetical protein